MAVEDFSSKTYDGDENWHISRGGTRSGPFRFAELVEAIDVKHLQATDYVWQQKWDNWRQAGSVPFLANLFESIIDGQITPKKSHPSKTELVQHLDLQLRENITVSWFSQYKQQILQTANTLLIAITLFCLIIQSTLIFDNSKHGVIYIACEFIALAIICAWVTKKKIRLKLLDLHLCVIFIVSAVLLGIMNIQRIAIGFDVWQAKQLLSHAQSSEHLRKAALDHPSNRFLAFLLATEDATEDSAKAITELRNRIERKEITLTTLRSASSRDQLVSDARALHTASSNAEAAMSLYSEISNSELNRIEEAKRKIYPSDTLFVAQNVLTAATKRHQLLNVRIEKAFTTIAQFYASKADVADLLIRNWDGVSAAHGRAGFADRETSEKYSKLAAAVRAIQASLQDVDRENSKLLADRTSMWRVKVGRPL
jgi:hypothetical protein